MMKPPVIKLKYHIGFTGTRLGMNVDQRRNLIKVLNKLDPGDFIPPELHHGDDDGADRQADRIARSLGFRIHLHIPVNEGHRAFCECRPRIDTLYEPKIYLDRNKDIVDASKALIAAPGEMIEQLRSGTWSTVRYARRMKKPVIILFPNGMIERHGMVEK